jgi:hypothetical protein
MRNCATGNIAFLTPLRRRHYGVVLITLVQGVVRTFHEDFGPLNERCSEETGESANDDLLEKRGVHPCFNSTDGANLGRSWDESRFLGTGVAVFCGDARPRSISTRRQRSRTIVSVTGAGINSEAYGLGTREAAQEIASFLRDPVRLSAFCRLFDRILLCLQPGKRRATDSSSCDFQSLTSRKRLFREQLDLGAGAFFCLGQLRFSFAIVDDERVVLSQF